LLEVDENCVLIVGDLQGILRQSLFVLKTHQLNAKWNSETSHINEPYQGGDRSQGN
jgi:hypothetical protein